MYASCLTVRLIVEKGTVRVVKTRFLCQDPGLGSLSSARPRSACQDRAKTSKASYYPIITTFFVRDLEKPSLRPREMTKQCYDDFGSGEDSASCWGGMAGLYRMPRPPHCRLHSINSICLQPQASRHPSPGIWQPTSSVCLMNSCHPFSIKQHYSMPRTSSSIPTVSTQLPMEKASVSYVARSHQMHCVGFR